MQICRGAVCGEPLLGLAPTERQVPLRTAERHVVQLQHRLEEGMDMEVLCLRLGWGLKTELLGHDGSGQSLHPFVGSRNYRCSKVLEVMLSPHYACRAGPLFPACSVPCI